MAEAGDQVSTLKRAKESFWEPEPPAEAGGLVFGLFMSILQHRIELIQGWALFSRALC